MERVEERVVAAAEFAGGVVAATSYEVFVWVSWIVLGLGALVWAIVALARWIREGRRCGFVPLSWSLAWWKVEDRYRSAQQPTTRLVDGQRWWKQPAFPLFVSARAWVVFGAAAMSLLAVGLAVVANALWPLVFLAGPVVVVTVLLGLRAGTGSVILGALVLSGASRLVVGEWPGVGAAALLVLAMTSLVLVAGLFRDQPLEFLVGVNLGRRVSLAIADRHRAAMDPPLQVRTDKPWRERPLGSVLVGIRPAAISVIVALTAVIVTVGVFGDRSWGVWLLFVLPVLLTAALAGAPAGLGAATVAVLAMIATDTVNSVEPHVELYAIAAVLFLTAAAVEGLYRDRSFDQQARVTILSFFIFLLIGNPQSDGDPPVEASTPDRWRPSDVGSSVVRSVDDAPELELEAACARALAGEFDGECDSVRIIGVAAEHSAEYEQVLLRVSERVSTALADEEVWAPNALALAQAVESGEVLPMDVVEAVFNEDVVRMVEVLFYNLERNRRELEQARRAKQTQRPPTPVPER